jgi:hypothetical protein
MSSILSQPNVNRHYSFLKIHFHQALQFYHTFLNHKCVYYLISPTCFDLGHLQGYHLILKGALNIRTYFEYN